MERRLILMRHAKSSWTSDAPSDLERPLNKRGKRDAPRVAQELVALGWIPGAVVTSPARRTRATWRRMREVFAIEGTDDVEVRVAEGLYHGDGDALRDDAERWPAEVDALLVLGHNPGFELALRELSGVAAPMTTGNAALLEGRGATWAEALDGTWRLVTVVRPRELSD